LKIKTVSLLVTTLLARVAQKKTGEERESAAKEKNQMT
jgi:hypothetical protein